MKKLTCKPLNSITESEQYNYLHKCCRLLDADSSFCHIIGYWIFRVAACISRAVEFHPKNTFKKGTGRAKLKLRL